MQTLTEPIQYCLKTQKFGVILVKIWGFWVWYMLFVFEAFMDTAFGILILVYN